MEKEIFLPTLPHWEFGNHWSGSRGRMRFYVTNSEAEDGEGKKRRELLAEVWTQDVCRELAEVEARETFPCTREGLERMGAWLEEQGKRRVTE